MKICILSFLALTLPKHQYQNAMIYNFSVTNFLSIRDTQRITFATTTDSLNRELSSVEVRPGVRINKIGIFYGPNASGKSNMLTAIKTIFSLLSTPQTDKMQIVPYYHPFALTSDCPTSLEMEFFIDSIKYAYAIEYCATHILRENLSYYPVKSRALFYERTFTGEDKQPKIVFGSTIKLKAKTRQSIIESTFNNHSTLSSVAKLALSDDAEQLTKLHKWVISNVHNIDERSTSSVVAGINDICADCERKEFYTKLLKKADFNIVDFAVADNPDTPQSIVNHINKLNLSEDKKLSLIKDVFFTSHSATGDFELASQYQSDGTIRFIELLPILYNTINGDHIYTIDEIGNKLDFELVTYFINLFLYNSDHSQLLFTTHDVMLLDEDFTRRDVIYIADKDRETASTSYTRISDIGMHKNSSLFNAYRYGKIGSRPEVGSPYLNK